MSKPGTFQFAIVNGDPLEHGPGTGILDERWSSTRSALYIWVETVPYRNRELCQRLVETIASAFDSNRLSTTGRLKNALTAASEMMKGGQ